MHLPCCVLRCADISKLKQAEAELRIAAAAFESQEGFLVTDAKGRYPEGQPGLRQHDRLTPDEVTGRPVPLPPVRQR